MKQPHNGKQSWCPGNKGNKTSKDCAPKETKKKPEKPEQKEDEVNDESEERSHDYKEWRHDIEEVMYKAFSRVARGYPVDGIYFDGEKFYTDNQDGRATLLYTGDDIDDFLEKNNMHESTVRRPNGKVYAKSWAGLIR